MIIYTFVDINKFTYTVFYNPLKGIQHHYNLKFAHML